MVQASRQRRPSVLVSGAGVAGCALAHWLLRAGMSPVLVEKSPAPREGGYMIDFWGVGFETAERMGLADRVRKAGYLIRELLMVNAAGKIDARLPFSALEGMLHERYVSLPRDDLAKILYSDVGDRVDVRFDDEIIALKEAGSAVEVMFRRGRPRRFDLVIGADGLHSKVREVVFGDEMTTLAPLGYFAAAFTVADYPHRDDLVYVSRTTPGRQVARYRLRDGRTAFFMVVSKRLAEGRRLASADRQRAFLAETFAGIGWEARAILRALSNAEDLYFDAVAQARLPAWSKGRVALVGDAAWCPSLLAGEGASLAMAGAMVLAGELMTAGSDYRRGFETYERRLRPLMQKKQRSALSMGAWFAPKTTAGVFLRNQLTRLAALPGLSHLLLGAMVKDDFILPRYEWNS
jgi:2-polyprenyl-6-methoxyphenol hydroxylase-like FAD-dependent oxidoreductase